MLVKNVSLWNPSLDPYLSGGGGGHYTVEGVDASLLEQQLDRRLALAESLQMDARIRLAAIPSVDKTIHGLGTFYFVDLHLLSLGGRHSSAVADILRLIERIEELHTEAQRMILSPHLATTLL